MLFLSYTLVRTASEFYFPKFTMLTFSALITWDEYMSKLSIDLLKTLHDLYQKCHNYVYISKFLIRD